MRSANIIASLLLGLLAVGVLSDAAQAQPGGRRGRGGAFGGGGDQLGMLSRPDIVKELEILDDQQDKIRGMREGMRDRFREVFGKLREESEGLSDEERRDLFRKKFEEIRKEQATELDSLLMPHQRERLKQIALQQQVRGRGVGGALAGDALTDALGLTEEQKKKIEEAAQDAEKKLQENVKKLREEANQKILAVLTPAQKQKYEKLFGKLYEAPERENRFGRGNRGNRGDRGGQRRSRPERQ